MTPVDFAPPFFMKNGHVQTIVPTLFRRVDPVFYQRERIETDDNDFLDLDWSRKGNDRLAIISHGLEGSSFSPYVVGMAKALNLAVTYNDLGRYNEAKDIFNQALSASKTEPGELDPFVRGKIANMYAEIGDVYQSCGLYEQAVGEYHKALALGPGFVDLRLKLAQTLRDQGKQEDSLKELKRVLEDNPNFIPARIHLGVTLYSMGRNPEAVAEWTEVLKQDPDNKSCQMYLNMIKEEES